MLTNFGILHGSLTAMEALQRLDQWDAGLQYTIVVRGYHPEVFHYLYVTEELWTTLIERAKSRGYDLPLEQALDLHEYESVHAIQVDASTRGLKTPLVVLDGDEPVGYLLQPVIPKEAAPKPSPAPPSPKPAEPRKERGITISTEHVEYQTDPGSAPKSAKRSAKKSAKRTSAKRSSAKRSKPAMAAPEIATSGTLVGADDWGTPHRANGGGSKRDDHGGELAMANGGGGHEESASYEVGDPGGAAASRTYIPKNGGSPPSDELPDFRAYPRLDFAMDGEPATRVDQGDKLQITVGFRPDEDLTLTGGGLFEADDVKAEERAELRFTTKGLDLAETKIEIPLLSDATKTLEATVRADAVEVECKVEYRIRGVRAGTAIRRVPVGDAEEEEQPEHNPCRLSLQQSPEPIDLTVTITCGKDGLLQWRFEAPALKVLTEVPLETTIEDPQDFAASFLDELKLLDYRDFLARAVLDTKSQRIREVMPDEFFTLLKKVGKLASAAGRLPTLLILTDEVYIPWELAQLKGKELLDANAPPFLGAQTIMGRWVESDHIQLPPACTCAIQKFLVFASQYGLKSKQPELKQAVEERAALVATYAGWLAEGLEARKAEFEKVMKAPKTPGTAVHFAVHGLSDPDANRQQLVLEDLKVPASALGAGHTCGDAPRFSFVFMNACQVGVAGKELGMLAGFPGQLVEAGCFGVVAPLWNVIDTDARATAEAFYKAVFDEGKSVAEALRERRATYTDGSTTPVAYIYYGHPGLKLTKGV